MLIKEILYRWNKNIQTDHDTYFWDELFKCYPENFYVIDQYPITIKDNNKYKQLEICYDAVLSGEISIDVYKNEENKLKNIMRKLWVYNLLEVETNLNEKDNSLFLKVIDSHKLDLIDDFKKKIIRGEEIIDLVELLDVLVELGARERVYSCFVFHDYKIIAVTNALDMPIFISDLSIKGLVERIVTAEGLYLRPCVQER